MNRKSGLLWTITLALVLSACSNKKDQGGVGDTTTKTTPPSVSEVDPNATNAFGSGYSAEDLLNRFGIEGDPINYRILYFQYNSTAIDERSRIIATRHAQVLAQRGGSNVNLEGHADERGTRDYNLALGERRAQTVASLMRAIDSGSRIQTISYGEERPAEPAHNEAAWQKNRRVEIKY